MLQSKTGTLTLANLAHLNGRFTTVRFLEGIFVFAPKAKESAITLRVQLPDILALHAPKNIRSAIASRDTSSSAEIESKVVGHADEAVRAVVRRVLFREGRMADW